MSDLETQILRQMQPPAADQAPALSSLQVFANGNAFGPTHLQPKLAGTERLPSSPAEHRTLPWLELQFDQSSHGDEALARKFPAMNDPFQFAESLKRAIPEIDKTGEGMSVSELKQYVHEHGSATPEAAAAGIALNHFDMFSMANSIFGLMFHSKITKAEIANFERAEKPFALMESHPELRDPSVFLSTMQHAFAKIDTDGDGILDRHELSTFINGSSGDERERGAAALILANNQTLATINEDGGFSRKDLLRFGALTNPNFSDELDASVAAAQQDQSNVAGGIVVGSVTGYAVSKMSGNQHPMRAAVVAGIAGGLINAYADGEPERIAGRLKDERQLLAQTGIFNLEVSK